MSTSNAAIRFSGLTKRFAGVVALRDVSFDVTAGSCHAVCGENGAGKSTLGRILAGISVPDAGHIEIDGTRTAFASPRDAQRAGIAMVHQELAFCENLTVAESLSLSALPRRYGFVRQRELTRRATALLANVGATLSPHRVMRSLSVAEQQLVQIAGAVGEGARVLVLDEPTSSLGASETAALYALMAALRERGVTIVFVSHRMPEIFRLCDTVTVLRDGVHVVTQPASAFTEATLVQAMIGRELAAYFPMHASREPGPELLRVSKLSSPGRFSDVSFSVRAGEIVGLAGLVGAGRSEVARALFGLDAACTGDVFVRQQRVALSSPRAAMRAGVGFVPEDRKKDGLILGMRARDNVTLPTLARFSHAGVIQRGDERTAVVESFARLAVRSAPETIAGTLSGGNQQKLVLAKWLTAGSDILLLDEPTRGVDVGAKAELHAWIEQRALSGAGVLLISSELPELLNVATRIVVLHEGRVHGHVSRSNANADVVLRMMAGLV